MSWLIFLVLLFIVTRLYTTKGLRCWDSFSYGILKLTYLNKVLGNLLTRISRVSVKRRAKSSIFRKPGGQRTIIKPLITTTTHSGRRSWRPYLYGGTTLVMSPVRPAYVTVTSRVRMSHIRCGGGSRTHNRKSLARALLYGWVSTQDCCNCGIGNRSQHGTQPCVSCWRRSEEFRDHRTVATVAAFKLLFTFSHVLSTRIVKWFYYHPVGT